ncbi:MAG TPA: NAD-dependent epimerase/dehydratase family protein [Amycolatopsis sp.]|nr:NAD-dependent epimerase/dehydratase family protein [Amycolatopsis sp.]
MADDDRVVAVVGASGLIGTAALSSFLDAGWNALAVSRRRPEPEAKAGFRHVPVDLLDRSACLAALRGERVTHLVYAAVYEKPGLVAGWSDTGQMRTNLDMLANVLDALVPAGTLEHVTIMQGTKAYGVHLHPIPVPARERAPRDDHPNFYWLQEDHLREAAAREGFGWTIFRPVQVVGPAYGSGYSVPAVMGVYSALCHAEGLPFAFPGGNVFPARQVVDARLVGDATVWAAQAERARGEHFNLTNGEVFGWHGLWDHVGALLGHEPAEPAPRSMGEFLPSRAAAWDDIVGRFGLKPLRLAQVLGQSHFYADYTFGYGLTDMSPPALVSTVKVKKAGFGQVRDTDETFTYAIRRLIEERIIPGSPLR